MRLHNIEDALMMCANPVEKPEGESVLRQLGEKMFLSNKEWIQDRFINAMIAIRGEIAKVESPIKFPRFMDAIDIVAC